MAEIYLKYSLIYLKSQLWCGFGLLHHLSLISLTIIVVHHTFFISPLSCGELKSRTVPGIVKSTLIYTTGPGEECSSLITAARTGSLLAWSIMTRAAVITNSTVAAHLLLSHIPQPLRGKVSVCDDPRGPHYFIPHHEAALCQYLSLQTTQRKCKLIERSGKLRGH